jgi:DNA-binding NarL/FixJ family response regulator
VKLLLVDDHPLFRSGLMYLLRTLDSQLEVDEAGNCNQALARAGRDYDLVLLDLKMPGVNGLDALSAIRSNFPQSPAVVLSSEDDPRIVRQAIDSGAMGYIPKSSTPDVMIQALRLILARGVYLPPNVLSADAEPAPKPPGELADDSIEGLSPRQMEVLRLVIQGKPNKVIAAELDISEATVKAHLSAVLRALGARNRTEVVYAAAKMGLRLV